MCEVFVSCSHEGVPNNDQSSNPFLPHIRTHPLFPACLVNGSIYHSAIHNIHTTITRLAFLAGSNFATLIFPDSQHTIYIHTVSCDEINYGDYNVRGSLVRIIFCYITSKCLLRYATEVTQDCMAHDTS